MQKYKYLMVSIIILIISFVCCYYSVQLLDKFFILLLLVYLLLFISYIKCLFDCLVKIHNEKNIINITTICILFINAVMILFFPFKEFKTYLELNLYEEDRNNVIELVKNNTLVVDDYGNAKLSKKQKKLSISGEIKIYKNDDEGQVIGFWIFRGMLSCSRQLIYTSLDYELIEENLDKHAIIDVKKLKENWYYIITEY